MLDATDITSPGTHTPEAGIQLSNSVTRATVKEPISERTQQRVFLCTEVQRLRAGKRGGSKWPNNAAGGTGTS